jgi:hypothetical protein
MEATERQKLRLQILKKLCEKLNYSLNYHINDNKTVFELLPDSSEDDILDNILYLNEKGYVVSDFLNFDKIPKDKALKNLRLTTKAIDLIEKLETNIPTEYYQQDFSISALNNFRDIINSVIIINSPNSSITKEGVNGHR